VTVQEALGKIWENRHEKSLNYAVNYAKYGMYLEDGEELRVQCLYVLGNITRWRGEVAKEVRQTLKDYTKKDQWPKHRDPVNNF